MRTPALAAFVLVQLAVPAAAVADDDDEEEEEDDEGEDEGKSKPSSSAKSSSSSKPFKKQNLTGHAIDDKAENEFEKDRFFVDKVDTKQSAKSTLVQGALTSTTFGYREAGGTIAPVDAGVPSNSPFSRVFTDLRLQTDFRHIAGGSWDARIDTRGRFVADPGSQTPNYTPATNSSSQSGLLGENELEIRELWIARSGKRTDVFLGRQFIPDLAGIKFDGVRFDYAQSSKFTLLGFGGLFPLRGSRSITTDYIPLKSQPDSMTGIRADAGRLTGAGGFGAAYRTPNAYGSFGGVALVPFDAEQPRIFGTSTGYWRYGPKVDFYHFAVLDLLGSAGLQLTNLSAGLNYKPDQRLRGTLSFHRVDTETLNVQAQAFLNDPDLNANIIQNEAFISRIAQNQARASLSAGLGPLQRFELTVAASYRYRDAFTLVSPVVNNPVRVSLPPGKSIEIYGGLLDRRSFKNLRLGVDGTRIFRVGDVAFQRTSALALRGYVARELASGKGEWEAEVAYTNTKDDLAGVTCNAASMLDSCFGAAKAGILSMGGNLYYRVNRNWFAMGNLFLNRYNITSFDGMMASVDPTVYGVSGFGRVARRF
jgi:hypothetical protein